MDLGVADRIWGLRADLTVEIHEVPSPVLCRFSTACGELFRLVARDAPDDRFWGAVTSELRRARFDLASNPVPYRNACEPTFPSSLIGRVRQMSPAYPDLAAVAQDLLEDAKTLVAKPDAPLLEHMFYRELLGPSTGLVVLRSRYIQPLRRYVEALDLEGVSVMRPSGVGRGDFFSDLVLFGPVEWFPDHVLLAPRSSVIRFVHFDWLDFDSPPPSAFSPQRSRTWGTVSLPDPVRVVVESPEGEKEVLHDHTDLESYVPQIDWEALEDDLSKDTDGPYEPVEARLCALDGQAAVWLRAHEDAEVFVLDITTGVPGIHQQRVEDLVPGEFLLVRTEGGGDHLVALAWYLLGDRAEAVRSAQDQWKVALSEAVASRGIRGVGRELSRLGAVSAGLGNIRNWMDPDRIQPADDRDFRAILKLAGLGERFEEFRGFGRSLHRARVRAGHRIREYLLTKAQECDARRLEENGRMTFQTTSGGGSIAAWRVEGVSPAVRLIPPHRILVPMERVEQRWLG